MVIGTESNRLFIYKNHELAHVTDVSKDIEARLKNGPGTYGKLSCIEKTKNLLCLGFDCCNRVIIYSCESWDRPKLLYFPNKGDYQAAAAIR